jgi:predicted amidohydrolase YtcJ
VNTAALNAVGVNRETQSFMGDPVKMDAAGEPTGVFTNPGPVNYITQKIVPTPSEAELKEMLRKIQDQLHAWGLTSTREVALPPEAMRAYQSLLRDGKLTMRIAMGLDVAATQVGELERILSPWGVGTGFGDHHLRLDSIGELGMEAGGDKHYLRAPYANRPDRGAIRITPAQLRQAMLIINRYGWRPSIHVMGDAALDVVLDAYEAADAEKSIRDKRWIVEHAPLVHPDQMERMTRLGVLVSAQIQPYFSADRFVQDYGKERADQMVPMRELLDHHLLVSTGSDWGGLGDLYEVNPFVNIYFYVTRKTRRGAVTGAQEKISREEALRVSTINNAYMTFEENAKGSIEPGKLADFVILSQDILTIPEDQIPLIRPLATYAGGQKVFSSKDGGF